MGMQHWTDENWTNYVEDAKRKRKPWKPYLEITQAQQGALRKFRVPEFVVQELNRHEACTVIGKRIDEIKEQQQEDRYRREEWLRTQQERRRAVEAAQKAKEAAAKKRRLYDPTTGLYGYPAQINWAVQIRTAVTPYIRSLIASTNTQPDLQEAFKYALEISDAAFWIAYKDLPRENGETLKRFNADLRRRMELDSLENDNPETIEGLDDECDGWKVVNET